MRSICWKAVLFSVFGVCALAKPLSLEINISVENDAHEPLVSPKISPVRPADDKDVPMVNLPYENHTATSSDDDFYWKFRNIPYAQPPVYSMRWKKAEHLESVENPELNDGNFTVVCPQSQVGWFPIANAFLKDFFGVSIPNVLPEKWDKEIGPEEYGEPEYDAPLSESCLYLDVMVPKRAYNAKKDRLHPVMVWIHGGGFVFGSKEIFGPPDGLFEQSAWNKKKTDSDSSEDFIFVAINYRLGAFGFLGGPDFRAQGGVENVGLSDQLVALEWVQKYIHLFGGDKEKVTVAGESAGASSILHHLVSNGGTGDKPPFRRAIIQSPAFSPAPDAYDLNSVYRQFQLRSQAFGLSGLRNAFSFSLIITNSVLSFFSRYGTFPFGPTVDGEYIQKPVSLSLKEGKYHKGIDIMVAHNRREGALFAPPWIRNNDQLQDTIIQTFPILSEENMTWISNAYSIDPKASNKEQELQAVFAYGDVVVDCNDYFIRKAYPNSFGYYFNLYPGYHSQDANYTFYPYGQDGPTKAIDLQAKRMQRYITAFIKTGGTTTGTGVDAVWKNWNESSKVMSFGSGEIVLGVDDLYIKMIEDPVNHTRCDWWEAAPYWEAPEVVSKKTQGRLQEPLGLEL